ncbi:hypothetical protein CEP53_006890 [Fusarium sp. AF-6]|nr:hypothetical protein CEP53_006890 [Fusarium sp. AF-6]
MLQFSSPSHSSTLLRYRHYVQNCTWLDNDVAQPQAKPSISKGFRFMTESCSFPIGTVFTTISTMSRAEGLE